VPQYFVLGGNAGDAIELTIDVNNEFNPNAYGDADDRRLGGGV